MNKPWRSIPILLALGPISCALALLALGGSIALAKGPIGGDGAAPMRSYVLTASGAWGSAQDNAVRRSGGTVLYSHASAGVATVQSSDPDFLRKSMKGGAGFGLSGEDMVVQ